MTEHQNYSEVVARAEKAVASVKDPNLKRIAFQRILDDLLGSSGAKDANGPVTRIARERKKPKGKAVIKGGPKAYIEELIDDGFVKKPRTISEVKEALANQGHHIPITSLSGPLQKLCQQKRLRRQKDAQSGNYTYSEW
jgi:hypothetical protein